VPPGDPPLCWFSDLLSFRDSELWSGSRCDRRPRRGLSGVSPVSGGSVRPTPCFQSLSKLAYPLVTDLLRLTF